MKIGHRFVTSDSHRQRIDSIVEILNRFNVPYKYQEDLQSPIPSYKFSIQFILYDDLPNFDDAKNSLDSLGIKFQTGTYYEKSDSENAEWFIVSTGEYQYPQPEDDSGYKTATFSLDNYCKFCGIGKVQNAPFRLRTEPKQPNNQFWGLHWEFSAMFVRERAKTILEKAKIAGIRFSKPVLHKKNTEIEGFYQLHIDTILSNGFDFYNTRTITCKINNEENCNKEFESNCCGRIKYHHPQIGGYLFDKTIFNPNFDIVESNEFFGSGCSANRLQIVSKRLKSIVEENHLKGLSFIPIMHNRTVQRISI